MNDPHYYEARLDKIFAKPGDLWKHRTFRTILDPASSEWEHTDSNKKLEILKKLIASGEDLSKLIKDYKLRYNEQNRPEIAVRAEEALAILLQLFIQKNQIKP